MKKEVKGMKPIAGRSPVTGQTVSGNQFETDYSILENELMQIFRKHKLDLGQAMFLLHKCEEDMLAKAYRSVL